MKCIKSIVIVAALTIAHATKPMANKESTSLESQVVQATLSDLPQYEIEEICQYLELQEIGRLRQTCRSLSNAWDHKTILSFRSEDIIRMIPQEFGIPDNAELGDIPKNALSAGISRLNKSLQNCYNPVGFNLACYPGLESYSPLTELPAEIGNLKNIIGLDLSNNHLTEADIKIISNLSNLRELYLSGNNLTELPVEIGKLTNLRELYLGDNQLTQKALVNLCNWLPNLEVLHLFGNHLTELPATLSKLTHLKQLGIADNQLTENAKLNIKQWLPNTDLLTNEMFCDLISGIFNGLEELYNAM